MTKLKDKIITGLLSLSLLAGVGAAVTAIQSYNEAPVTASAAETTFELVPAVAATCTEMGHKAYYKASDGYYYTTSYVKISNINTWLSSTSGSNGGIAKLGHDLDALEFCTRCDYSKHQGYIELKQSYVAPTCTKDGQNAYYYCSNPECERYFTSNVHGAEVIADINTWKTTYGQGKITKLGHDFSNPDESCANGCGEFKHGLTTVAQKNATCTTDGVKEYFKCNCGAEYFYFKNTSDKNNKVYTKFTDLTAWKSGDGKIAKTGHSYSTTSNGCTNAACTDSNQKYTHKSSGSGTNLAKASDCKAATCTETGIKDYYTCTAHGGTCANFYFDKDGKLLATTDGTNGGTSVVISTIADWKTDATKGMIPATGHNFGADNSENQCLNINKNTSVRCDVTHDPANKTLIPGQDATCLDDGHVAYYECVCGKYEVLEGTTYAVILDLDAWMSKTVAEGGYIIPATGHSAAFLAADHGSDVACENPGCTLVHTYSPVTAVAASCKEYGVAAYDQCGCGEAFKSADGVVHAQSALETWKNTSVNAAGGQLGYAHNLDNIALDVVSHGKNPDVCGQDGWIPYYICHTCNQYFAFPMATYDSIAGEFTQAGEKVNITIALSAWTTTDIANGGGKFVSAHSFSDACGGTHHCDVCGNDYSGTTGANKAITKHNDNGNTCANEEYYTCICGKIYEEAACTTEITDPVADWSAAHKNHANSKAVLVEGYLPEGCIAVTGENYYIESYTCECGDVHYASKLANGKPNTATEIADYDAWKLDPAGGATTAGHNYLLNGVEQQFCTKCHESRNPNYQPTFIENVAYTLGQMIKMMGTILSVLMNIIAILPV